MKREVNMVTVGIVLAVVVLLGGYLLWNKTQGVNGGSGKLQSDLGEMEKDPEKMKKGLDELIKKSNANAKGQ